MPDLLVDKAKAAFDTVPFAGTELGERYAAAGT